ncbi:MAG: DEAD/DEAH box helicase [Myxococcaceae bacterium]|nr:DEAD/DEAH box helicase [Myxococcaceae bacterium]
MPGHSTATALSEAQAAPLTRFHERLLAFTLTARPGSATARAAQVISEARVDLNPHQIEAAAFALEALPRGGCLLADEVGLGKTIEAGIVIAQRCLETKGRVLILTPATLRAQWQAELRDKFDLESFVVDSRTVRATGNPFDQPGPVIASIPFAAFRPEHLKAIPWDLVVIDEAHRLRNSHQPSNKTGKALRSSLAGRPKLLLTATPLQNNISELFGLLSLLDEQILGPEEAFKTHFPVDGEGGMEGAAATDLKTRLAPVVQRTLRRQVREYVRFTNRRSIVEDFTPSASEQSLYDDVSDFLRRSEALSLDPGRKTLLSLVYRKLLASSTFAIAPTLERLAQSLEKRLEVMKTSAQATALLEGAEEVSAYPEEAEDWADDEAKPVTVKALQGELHELKTYAKRASAITVNAKGEALKRALDRVFTVARAHQWPEKAVVFTESKRTQQYLFELLSKHGFEGKISVLSGDAGTPEARKALVDEFRERTQILLSTEAGAEGLNLQFCNLVVNYDLPWNPQRVEQRIGRCHRYGQQRDVVVLNFLNRQNAADARLYELLEKKLTLFDGVFGASDEILGALESGVDFERRVLDIYQSCRTPEEINAAFAALRSDLESRIESRMTEARSLLLERFDGDVRRRLKLAGDAAQESLKQHQAASQALVGSVLGPKAKGRKQLALAAKQVRERTDDAVSYLELDGGTLPGPLHGLAGKEGWWFAYRLELSGLKPEEKVVHLVLVRHGEGFKVLPADEAARLVEAQAKEVADRRPPSVSMALEQEKALVALRESVQVQAERSGALELDAARERADRYAEDCLLAPRAGVEKAKAAWETARQALPGIAEPPERMKARAACERLERDYRRKLKELRALEDQKYAEKDRTIAELTARAKVVVGRSLIASAYFWVS